MVRKTEISKWLMLTVGFTLLAFNWLYAVDYAGPDRHICPGTNTPIGNPGEGGVCYAWTPETGLSDPHSANPIASPTTTTTYTVNVVGPNFSYTASDQVTVFVENQVSGIHAETLICCWKTGDPITESQFKITTTPPGMEQYITSITFDPSTAPMILSAMEQYTITVTATIQCGTLSQTLNTTAQITVVEEGFEVSESVGLSGIDVDALTEACDYILGVLKKVPGPCGVSSGGTALSVTGTTTNSLLCCPDPVCVKPAVKYSGSLAYSPSLSCNFPFLGVPYVASVNIYLTAGVGASVTLDGLATTCEGFKACIAADISANAGGGVSATVLGGSVINASLALIVSVRAPLMKYCFPANSWAKEGSFCAKADIVGSVTLLTFFTKSFTVTLVPEQCM